MVPNWLDIRNRQGREIAAVLIVVCVGASSFALGRLSVRTIEIPAESGITIRSDAVVAAVGEKGVAVGGSIVASKAGSKYHFPWCAGAQSIKEENKIWFASPEEARAKGYLPAQNCKGLK